MDRKEIQRGILAAFFEMLSLSLAIYNFMVGDYVSAGAIFIVFLVIHFL